MYVMGFACCHHVLTAGNICRNSTNGFPFIITYNIDKVEFKIETINWDF